MNLKTLRRNWENLACLDPLWAVCNDPSKKGQKWDKKEFFLSGEIEVNTVISYIQSLGLEIDFSGKALDFGCGVGRLTQALAKRFNFCYGVDISPTMIKLARQYNPYESKCIYLKNYSDKLDMFDDNTFSFIYSSLTLQHLGIRYVKRYLREFITILKPGKILVFQMPSYFIGPKEPALQKLRQALRLRTRLKSGLNLLGLSNNAAAVDKPRIEMYCMPEGDVCNIVKSYNAKIVDIVTTNSTALDFNGRLLYLKEKPRKGYISKQYCVVK